MAGSCPLIKSILVLDGEGKRISVKYFDSDKTTTAAQTQFEKFIYNKTVRTNARGEAEVILLDDIVVVYRFLGDLMFYVVGDDDENEIVLFTVLTALTDALSILLRGAVEKRSVLENLDLLLLSVDEVVDGGIVLETDAAQIASRVAMRGVETEGPGGGVGVPGAGPSGASEPTLAQALAQAKEQLTRSFNFR